MQEITGWHGGKIKAWIDGVNFEQAAQVQAHNVAALPFIHEHVALMPDVHAGYGATVGSVIPTKGAIIPSAVGVDIGCGMVAVRTSLTGGQLPDNLFGVRSTIERAVPHGGQGARGGWGSREGGTPNAIKTRWNTYLEAGFRQLVDKHPLIENSHNLIQLGSLGGGNHFIEICLDTEDRVWAMLHSGSRHVGNVIGNYFISKAKEHLHRRGVKPLDDYLAWLEEGEPEFDDYIEAVSWGQEFARHNREAMMLRVLQSLRDSGLPSFKTDKEAVNCHHNYVAKEHHFGADIYVTRKGAVRAGAGELGIIPGSMGAKSYIVRGKGNAESFCSCSHGAGRTMSRTKAKQAFTVEDHIAATAGIECRKDIDVIDETPGCYKDIDAVIAAQGDLIEVVHTLRQVICVKG